MKFRLIKRIGIIIFILIILSATISGQDETYFNYEILEYVVDIDKNVYEIGEPLEINNLIINNGTETIEIEVSNISSINFNFNLSTINGKIIEKSIYYYETIERASIEKSHIRKETIHPGEEFGKFVYLDEYYEDLKPGRYILEPVFYPLTNLSNSFPSLSGKKIQIQIVPIDYEDEVIPYEEEREFKPLAPFDTIDFVLEARMNNDWDAFFKYFDLSEIIKLYESWEDRLNKLPKSKTSELIEEFKDFLEGNFEPNIIGYDVKRSTREKSNAIVIAEIYRGSEQVTLTIRYTFYLEKRNDFWIIVDFEVLNLGS